MSTAAYKIVEILTESDEDIDPKDFVQSRNIQMPRFWKQIKVGQVLSGDGSYYRIRPMPDGIRWYEAHKLVFYDQYDPSFAYGKYTQRHSRNGDDSLHGFLVQDGLEGASDEQLWALVIEELAARRRGRANESLNAEIQDRCRTIFQRR